MPSREAKPEFVLPVEQQATFEGFRRPTARSARATYVGILTSVNCSATAARFIAEEVKRSGMLADYPNVDGVIALTHGTGCGIDYNGEKLRHAEAHAWGYACNPNMAAVLVVGLGCEGFQIKRMKEPMASRRATSSAP
jgi:altronate hydrolase